MNRHSLSVSQVSRSSTDWLKGKIEQTLLLLILAVSYPDTCFHPYQVRTVIRKKVKLIWKKVPKAYF